ncbi:hypothetical protein RhiJN_11115 [Ceratobasidium sp. AG-Ba]|nr:hypothetical protein RhiJN_11115 [Ceratobasidium sp. AG-Ba]
MSEIRSTEDDTGASGFAKGFGVDDHDLNPTVDEVCQVILKAGVVHKAIDPIDKSNDLSGDTNPKDVAQLGPAVISIRPQRGVRRSTHIKRSRVAKKWSASGKRDAAYEL